MGAWLVLRVYAVGVYTFQNEFVSSTRTAMPFLFALFFETRVQRTVMLAGSIAMAIAVLSRATTTRWT